MKRRTFIRDRTGEGYVDVAISLILVFVIVAGIFSLFPIYTTYQSLNATARQVAHVIEVCGQADEATLALAIGQDGLVSTGDIAVETDWHNASTKKIQLKTPFTVTVSKRMLIPILRPVSGSPIGFNILISAKASGISEVYWKE